MQSKTSLSKLSVRMEDAKNDVEWANCIAVAWQAAALASRSDGADHRLPARLRVLKHGSKTKDISFEQFADKKYRTIDIRSIQSAQPQESDEIVFIPSVIVEVAPSGESGPIVRSHVSGPFGVSMPYIKGQKPICAASRLLLAQLLMLIKKSIEIPTNYSIRFLEKMCADTLCVNSSDMASCDVARLAQRLRSSSFVGTDSEFRLVIRATAPATAPGSPASPDGGDAGAHVTRRVQVDLTAAESGMSVISIPIHFASFDDAYRSVYAEIRKLVPAKFGDFNVFVGHTRLDLLGPRLLACGWSSQLASPVFMSRVFVASSLRVVPL